MDPVDERDNDAVIRPHAFKGVHGVVSTKEESFLVCVMQCLLSSKSVSDYYLRKRYQPHIPNNAQGFERKHRYTTFVKDFMRDMMSFESGNL